MSDKDNVIPFRKRQEQAPQTTNYNISVELDPEGHIVNAFVTGDFDGNLLALAGQLLRLTWLVSDYHRTSGDGRDPDTVVVLARIDMGGSLSVFSRDSDFETEEQAQWLTDRMNRVQQIVLRSSAEEPSQSGET